ncbi:hypothetical protein JCM11491_002464 [Sporobolomyces phaffii]
MPLEYKVVVLGGGGVGKSALTVRFVHSLFVEKYDPTIEDSYRRTITVDGITVALEVLDTAGTEQFMSLHHMYIKSGDGFLLVFSLTSLESVSELYHLREQIQRIKDASNTSGLPHKVPIVLVGSKLDLVHERQVQQEVAVNLSQSWGGVPYYETSSRREINIEEVFADVTRQMIKAEQLSPQYQRRRRENGGYRNASGMDGIGGKGSGKGGRRRKCTIL